MLCPKCGRSVKQDAVICPACEFILDASFLGDDITDEDQDERRGQAEHTAIHDFGEALILGDGSSDFESFEAHDPGLVTQEVTRGFLYVSGASQALLAPDAIAALVAGVNPKQLRLTPFEQHLLQFIDGKTPVDRVRRKSGMEDLDVKTTLATLADKGVIFMAGRAFADKPGERPKQPAVRRVRDETDHRTEEPTAPAQRKVKDDVARKPRKAAPAPAEATVVAAPPPEPPRRSKPPPRAESTVLSAPPEPPPRRKPLSRPVAVAERTVVMMHNPFAEGPGSAKGKPPPTRVKEVDTAAPPPPREEPPPAWDDSTFEMRSDHPELEAARDALAARADDFDGDAATSAAQEALAAPPDDVTEEPVAVPDPPPEAEAAPEDVEEEAPEAPPEDVEEEAQEAAPEDVEEEAREAAPEDVQEDVQEAAPEDVEEEAQEDVPEAAPEEVAEEEAARADVDLEPPEPAPRREPSMVMDLSEFMQPLPAPRPPPKPAGVAVPVEAPRAVAPPRAAPPPPAAPPPSVRNQDDEESIFSPRAEPARPSPAPVAAAVPVPAAEPAAGGKIPHSQRMRAAKIFEQALKDLSERNISSARMNAKLAAIYDPGEPRYAQALLDWEQAQRAPRNAARPPEVVLFEQAQAAEARSDFQQATALLEQAIALAPAVGALHNRLGVLLATRLKELDRAVRALERAIELDPNNLNYKNNLGKVLGMQATEQEQAQDKRGLGAFLFGKKDEKAVVVKAHKFRPKDF